MILFSPSGNYLLDSSMTINSLTFIISYAPLVYKPSRIYIVLDLENWCLWLDFENHSQLAQLFFLYDFDFSCLLQGYEVVILDFPNLWTELKDLDFSCLFEGYEVVVLDFPYLWTELEDLDFTCSFEGWIVSFVRFVLISYLEYSFANFSDINNNNFLTLFWNW